MSCEKMLPASLNKVFGSLKELAPEAMGKLVSDAIEFRDGLLVRSYKEIKDCRKYTGTAPTQIEIELKEFLGLK